MFNNNTGKPSWGRVMGFALVLIGVAIIIFSVVRDSNAGIQAGVTLIVIGFTGKVADTVAGGKNGTDPNSNSGFSGSTGNGSWQAGGHP